MAAVLMQDCGRCCQRRSRSVLVGFGYRDERHEFWDASGGIWDAWYTLR